VKEKKEGRIKSKHISFTACVCASNENARIFMRLGINYDTINEISFFEPFA